MVCLPSEALRCRGIPISNRLSGGHHCVNRYKVRAIGSSTFAADRIVEAQWTAERYSLERYRCDQSPYSLFRRGIERAVLPACRRYGMGAITWSPLDGGWLSGRYRTPDDFTQDSRLVRQPWRAFDPDSALNRRKLELVNQIGALADDAGLSTAHLAMAWVLVHPDVTSVIIGPRTMAQLENSLAALNIRFDDGLLDALDVLVPPGTDVNPLDEYSDPAELGAEYRRGRLTSTRQ